MNLESGRSRGVVECDEKILEETLSSQYAGNGEIIRKASDYPQDVLSEHYLYLVVINPSHRPADDAAQRSCGATLHSKSHGSTKT